MDIMSLFAAPINKIVDSIGAAIDKNVTSDEERQELKNQLEQIQQDAQLKSKEIELQFEQQLSERHKYDMQSDDKWSKRVRPLSLVFLLCVTTILAVTDGNLHWNEWQFVIEKDYIELYKTLLVTAFGFYFGGRSLEKAMKMWKK